MLASGLPCGILDRLRRGFDMVADPSASEDPTLSPEYLARLNAYWRASNYLSVGQIYLLANP
ncbi:MAG: hypothetical protein ABW110_11085, partial [Steroidobacteraceae bacterium]